jgi:protocatechuate 3,4-dioxygenase beta subunit
MLGGLLVWAPFRAPGQAFGINQITNVSVSVGTSLAIPVSVTDSNIPPSLLNFTLASNRPHTDATNATISLNYGLFTWTPAQTQVVTFTVTAISLSTLYQTSTNFTVIVTNNVTPVGEVVIDPILPQTVAEGTLLAFTSTAHAVDNPASPLFFRLVNPPEGASMTNNGPTSGVFTWTPTTAQAATPFYTIREVVTELSTLATNYQDFQVTVTLTNNCAQYADFLAAVEQGGYFLLTNCSAIVLTNTLTISKSVILNGGSGGVTIAGNNLLRLFTVMPGANLTLYGVTLQGGNSTSGGAIYISSGGEVLMTNCILAGNSAVGTNGAAGKDASSGGNIGKNGANGTAGIAALGGAIYNLGALTVSDSSFLTNSAAGGSGGSGGNGGDGTYQGGNGGNGGAGALGYGGAIYNLGTLALTNCTFSGNTASGGSAGSGGTPGTGAFPGNAGRGAAGASGSGAAIYSRQSVTAVNCTFSGNSAQSGSGTAGGTDSSSGNGVNGPPGPDSLGGGIYVRGSGALTNCTFVNNTVAGGNGGNGGDASSVGVHIAGDGGNGGNGLGGGLYNIGAVIVVNCTFSSCGATGGTNGVAGSPSLSRNDGTPGSGRGGDIAQAAGSFVLRNTILAASSAGTNAYDTSASRITDGGYNISSDASLNLSGTSRKNTDPKLGSLADNGGPTQTIALQTNSPALNRVPAALSPATDQRGVPRPQPQGAAGDIGAYELVTLPAILTQPQNQIIAQGSDATFTVFAFGDSLTYQWRFDGTDISGATLSAYTLSNGQATNTGDYDVVLTDNYGSVTSLTAQLTVYPFTISGQVFDETGTTPLPGVLIQVTNSFFASSTNTDDNGQFVIPGLDSNTVYTVVASLPCYLFSPASTNVSVELANVTGLTFFASNDFHSVSGVISNGPAGVAVTFTGSNGTTTVTSGAGVYGVSNLCAGFYFVVPSLPGYQFQPPTNSVLVPPDANTVNFTAVQIFSIGGQITQGTNGPGLSGVSVAVSGPIATNVTTGANGTYVVGGLPAGTYVITPLAPGCFHLNLPTRSATLGLTDASGMDFVTLRDAYTISGHLTNGAAGVSGIMVSAGATNVTLTAATGLYVFSNLCAGSYTVTPSASCYAVIPASRTVSVGPGDMNGVDFGASALVYTLTGRITESGVGVSNITVQAGNQTTNTDSSGNYAFSGLCPGPYTVTPSQGCRLFNPASVPVTLGPNASGVNFTTFSNNLSRIRGQITDGVNGLSNVRVTVTGGGTALTDANGNYAFANLCPGTYTVTPSLTNYCFNTPFLTVMLGSAQTTNGVNFIATPGQYHISGTLAGMPPGPQVAVSIARPNGTTVLITSTGAYGISNLCPGTYSVTPSNACYQFYPLSWTTTVGPSDDSLDFAVSGGGAFSIGGQVTYNRVGLSNVTVIAAGQTNVTDASGNYVFPHLCPGVYAVTASALNFQFNPATNYVTLSSADSNGANFAAFQVASLSGRVVQGANGLLGVKVLAGTNISFTGAGGYYTNFDLREGTDVLVVPSLAGYAFAPSAQSLVVVSNTTLPDFMAFPSLALAQATNGAFKLTFAPGLTCQVLASGDLSHWQPVFTTNNISTNTPLLQFTDSDAANLPMRFYRVGQTFAASPVLTNVVAANHSVSLGCVAAPILACQIYASTNLTSWVTIFSTNLPAAAPFQFRYDDATNSPVRFYRLSQTPGF